MKKIWLLFFVFSGCALYTPLQKSQLIAVYHLIEASKFEDAKELVEAMVLDKDASGWSRTWYARGILCRNAYQEGRRTNDRKKFELYPDQLYVAYRSFERARILNGRGRMKRQIAHHYIYLANEFVKMGEAHYRRQESEEALRAYEQAITIINNPILSGKVEMELIYNTALAAFQAKDWEKSIKYLEQLNNENYSPNVSHLMHLSYLEKKDTLQAEKALRQGIRKYDNNQDLVIVLVDFLHALEKTDIALSTLNSAIQKRPDVYILHFTKGLIYQKNEEYPTAIESYKKALEVAPDQIMTYLNIAVCYFNMGVEFEENASALLSNTRVAEEKAQADEAYKQSQFWLDKLYETEPKDQLVLIQLYELYRNLGVSDKARGIQRLFN